MKGGLGNQLFQLATGISLSLMYETDLFLDTSFVDKSISHKTFTQRDSSLRIFQHKFNVLPAKYYSLYGIGYSISRVKRLINWIKFKQHSLTYFHESEIQCYRPELLNDEVRFPVVLDGYFQTEKYFRHIRPIICEMLDIKLSDNEYIVELKNSIDKSNSVSIHFRRGDYVNNDFVNKIHGTCSLDYYYKACREIAEEVENPCFFIFSDDIQWVKENFNTSFLTSFSYVENIPNYYEELKLMSCCKYNIIANSTFSWWGAWLNNNPDKIVISPSKWFNSALLQENTKDLIPDSWIRI
ncbi:MAG: alpha-1,2-fucosyltransferase [Breznakibacter sp.]|nr:alpha-1,2-fucosyltransferase [Breznakibacter sp.]